MTAVEQVDVLIVGSGPSGTSTALHLVQQDPAWASRILIIDKAVHPREKLCGGGITHIGQNILTRLGLPLEPSNFEVKEAQLRYYEHSYSLFGNPVFRIVRRDEFDHWLVQQARARGVTVREGEAVIDIQRHAGYVTVQTPMGTIHAQVVVAADGARSFVRRRLKWADSHAPPSPRVARLIEVLTPENATQHEAFQQGIAVFDFTPMSEHELQGFYWVFPSFINGKPYMNRGVFDSRARPERPKADLKETIRDELSKREKELDDFQLQGHPIRWWHTKNTFAQPRVLLVGDAAGVDPLFGEGISFALGYGNVAAASVTDAFARQDFSFASYQRRLRRHPLFLHLRLRTQLARFAYLLKYPWLFRVGWRLARWIVKLTPWRDPNYVPAQSLSIKAKRTSTA